MKFEILKKSHIKRNIQVGILLVAVTSIIILNFTRAKYQVTESIPLVNGTINYSLPDINIIALYIDGVETEELDSTKKYILDTELSTCTYKDGSTINNLTLSYDNKTKTFSISPYTTKGTKCTLYFDEYVPTAGESILANYPTQLIRTDFSTTITNTTTRTIYYADTSKGRTYYFAGNPTDNWVKFGGFYWRIIRINEDGTLRLIYQGTSTNTTGTGTQIGTSRFNSSSDNNAYVGFKYSSNQVHGLGTNSIILSSLNTWYQSNLTGVSDKIDGNAGFCGDRMPSTNSSTSNGLGGTGVTETYYGGYIRLYINKSPTFECSDEMDLYTTRGSSQGNKTLTYPIGLITADEVAYAGGVYDSNNQSYYLYTGEYYWTISPFSYYRNYGAWVFRIGTNGEIVYNYVDNSWGIRPVINLKADVTLTGSGTSTDPYRIS